MTLSPPRLGLALTALTAAAWITGVPYLFIRLGLPLPVAPAAVDGPHIYLGLAMAGLLVLKAAEVGLRTHLPRMPGVLLWQRWLSYGLLGTYGAVFLSGAVLMLPLPAVVRRDLVDLHLLSAVWAGLLSLVHLAVYLRRRLPPGILDLRLGAALALALLPAALFAAAPVAASPTSQLGGGGRWSSVTKDHPLAFRIAKLPSGTLVSAGFGLRVSTDHGQTWSEVQDLQGYLLLALAVGPGGSPLYAGGPGALYTAPRPDGPYRRLSAPADADSLYVEPAGGTLWLGGHGVWRSADGGSTWQAASAGLIQRGSVWAFLRYGGDLYLAASTGVYRLEGATWRRQLALPEVVSLAPTPSGLWAASMGGGLAVLQHGRWHVSTSGLQTHGGALIHQQSVLATGGGRLFTGSMKNGVAESLDGGAGWYPVSPDFRPGGVWQLVEVPGGILAATDTGIYRYQLQVAPAPPAAWWLALAGAAILLSAAAARAGLRVTAAARRPPIREPAGQGAAAH